MSAKAIVSQYTEKFSFVGPIDQFNKAEHLNDEVMVVYDMVTNQEQLGTSRITEWFKVQKEKIVSVEVFFEAHPFAAMFAH